MSDWVKGYRAALRDFVVKNGTLANVDLEPYGWRHPQWRHIYDCEIVDYENAKVSENTWSEFENTFTDNSYHHGVDLIGVNCRCGKVRNADMRWEGTVGEIMNKILLED